MDQAADLAVTIAGWMNMEEVRWLYRAAELFIRPGGQWVEVGCWKGRSLVATALGAPIDSSVFGVENFKGNEGSDKHWELKDETLLATSWVRKTLENNLYLVQSVQKDKRVTVRLIEDDSIRAATFFADESLDGVFIDASHEEDDVVADIKSWLPKVRRGGLVCGHDMCVGKFAGVRSAVTTQVPRWMMGPGSIWFYVRE